MAILEDIKRAISHGWNATARRFTDPKTGRFLSKNQVDSILDTGISNGRNTLQNLAESLSTGKIGLDKFVIQTAQTVKELHIFNAVKSKGGRVDQLSQKEKTVLQARVKQELLGGKDPKTGDKFGLKFLVKDIMSGSVTDAQLKNRLNMYADSAGLTAEHIRKQDRIENGYKEGFRQLGGTDKHCSECVTFATLGWVKLEDLVMPGSQCSCRSNCKCSIIYR